MSNIVSTRTYQDWYEYYLSKGYSPEEAADYADDAYTQGL